MLSTTRGMDQAALFSLSFFYDAFVAGRIESYFECVMMMACIRRLKYLFLRDRVEEFCSETEAPLFPRDCYRTYLLNFYEYV